MSIMDNFEGIKKIKNDRNMEIENIFEALSCYKNELGEIKLEENGKIIIDIDGHYYIQVYITDDGFIKIERIIEEDRSEGTRSVGYGLKSVDLSKADRMVEQIYDFLNTVDSTGDIVEPITSAKNVLYVKQEEGILRNHFYFTDENGNKKYEIKENKILQSFTGMNSETREEEFVIQYSNKEDSNYLIVRNSSLAIPLKKKKEAEKITFNGDVLVKNLQVSGDYTKNHFNIELDEIVIGAVDCLNDTLKDSYRIEINDLNYEYLIVAITIIIDMDYNA